MHKHENNTPSLPDVFRTYVRFATEKFRSDTHRAFEYSSGALDVVMDYIADNIEDPAIQGLAAALGEWEVWDDDEGETDDGA